MFWTNILVATLLGAQPGIVRGETLAGAAEPVEVVRHVAADVVLKGGTLIDGTGRRVVAPTSPCEAIGSWPSAPSRSSPAPRSSTPQP